MERRSPSQPHLILLLILFLSSPPTSISTPSETASSRHFLLVHGACHGAWSWYKVSTILKSWGHNVTALDMASCGIDRRQAKTLSSYSEYFQPLTDFLEALPSGERVVLVGHSLGGMGVAKAMEDFPEKISVAVFVAAAMAGPNLSSSAIGIEDDKQRPPPLDSHFVYEDGPNKPPTGFIFGPLKLASHLYPLSPPQDVTLATTLVRPHGARLSGKNASKEFVFTWERYGSVRRAFVVTEKDLMATRKFQLWMVEKNPPDIVVEIKGADHMVMASKPLELAHQLQHIAHQFSVLDI